MWFLLLLLLLLLLLPLLPLLLLLLLLLLLIPALDFFAILLASRYVYCSVVFLFEHKYSVFVFFFLISSLQLVSIFLHFPSFLPLSIVVGHFCNLALDHLQSLVFVFVVIVL